MQQATPTWFYNVQIGATTTIQLPIGGPSGSSVIANTQGYKYLHFHFRYDVICTLTILVGIETSALYTWQTLAGVANTVMTPYDLATPVGDSGFLPILAPYMRLDVNNGTAGATAFSKFYAFLCN